MPASSAQSDALDFRSTDLAKLFLSLFGLKNGNLIAFIPRSLRTGKMISIL